MLRMISYTAVWLWTINLEEIQAVATLLTRMFARWMLTTIPLFLRLSRNSYCSVPSLRNVTYRLDVRGSVHHSIIHIENPTRCNSVSKFYFKFIWNSTCFGRHTAHHQEPKTALAASGLAKVEGCWTCSCWMLSGIEYEKLHCTFSYSTWQRPATTRPTTLHVCKNRGC